MKQRSIGRLLAGLVITSLMTSGAVNAASEAFKYSPTSVAPTLPGPDEVLAMRENAQRGILSALRLAFRRSHGRGWSGIPALDRSSAGDTIVEPSPKP